MHSDHKYENALYLQEPELQWELQMAQESNRLLLIIQSAALFVIHYLT